MLFKDLRQAKGIDAVDLIEQRQRSFGFVGLQVSDEMHLHPSGRSSGACRRFLDSVSPRTGAALIVQIEDSLIRLRLGNGHERDVSIKRPDLPAASSSSRLIGANAVIERIIKIDRR